MKIHFAPPQQNETKEGFGGGGGGGGGGCNPGLKVMSVCLKLASIKS